MLIALIAQRNIGSIFLSLGVPICVAMASVPAGILKHVALQNGIKMASL
jgi:hypothetical protein